MTQPIQQGTLRSIDTDLQNAIRLSLDTDAAFALWKLPDSTAVYFAGSRHPVGIHEVVLEDMKPGFLFAPFDPGEKKILLPADEFFVHHEGKLSNVQGEWAEVLSRIPAESAASTPHTYHIRQTDSGRAAEQSAYEDLVVQCREAIIGGRFEKLVPTRFKEVAIPEKFDLALLFLELGRRYPSAMVSVFSSPQSGTWIGATPEMLVKVDANQHFHTVAVAGTQRYVPGTDLRSITWTQKEIEEQALVERYIISCFKKIRLREFDERGPRTVIAGNVVHLKTEFEVDMEATRYPQLGSVMLQLLHPTSAVCGMPMEASMAFLKENEGYVRQFYSGYLGPVGINNEVQLFVNLRCMQLGKGIARLYAGGGVLGDSDPEKEWQETELKLNTLLSVIRNYLT